MLHDEAVSEMRRRAEDLVTVFVLKALVAVCAPGPDAVRAAVSRELGRIAAKEFGDLPEHLAVFSAALRDRIDEIMGDPDTT